MGKPVWILLPHLADWRWMQQTEKTPWYPTARLLRQRKPDDWTGVVERVIEELRELLAAGRSQTIRPTTKESQPPRLAPQKC